VSHQMVGQIGQVEAPKLKKILRRMDGVTYLANSRNSRVNALTTVDVFHCTFAKEKVNIISNFKGSHKVGLCLHCMIVIGCYFSLGVGGFVPLVWLV